MGCILEASASNYPVVEGLDGLVNELVTNAVQARLVPASSFTTAMQLYPFVNFHSSQGQFRLMFSLGTRGRPGSAPPCVSLRVHDRAVRL